MTRWYLNDVEIVNSIVTTRKIDTPWRTVTHNIPSQKAVVLTPSQDPALITVNTSLRGSNRFSMETSIRAELESTPSILLKSTGDYVFENRRTVWIVPSGFGVTDKGKTRALECVISAVVDERTIHGCDFTDNWAGTSLTADTDTKYGKNSIKTTEQGVADHLWTYTPDEAMNLVGAERLCFWIKATQISTWFDTLRIEVYTNSNYEAWDMPTTFPADTWAFEDCDISLPDVTSGTVDYSNITDIKIRSHPLNDTAYSLWLAWVFVE